MKREKSRKLIAELELNENDSRTFNVFTPFGEQMAEFEGKTMQTIDTGVMTYRDKKYSQLMLAEEGAKEAKVINLVIAFNAQNVFVGDSSISEIGQKGDVDEALANLSAFTVDEVEKTGEWPARRSAAAEDLNLEPTGTDLTREEWAKLNAKYDSKPKFRKGATDEKYQALSQYEIHKINITPLDD